VGSERREEEEEEKREERRRRRRRRERRGIVNLDRRNAPYPCIWFFLVLGALM
jgi:hypothetical protein